MEEIVGDPVLEFGQRGVTTEVYTFEHEGFPVGFSGNTIRVCPVGALMSKPFRFRARPWELIKTPSVCSLCSVGCNLREDVRENKLLRVVGLENPKVNDGWLCDRGQFGYDYINSGRRLDAPMIRNSHGELERASWDDALSLIASKLKQIRETAGGAVFGALGSERCSNEDNFVLQQFTREVMGSPNIDHRMGSIRTGYDAMRPQPGAIVALPKADVVLLIGTDLTAEAPVLDLILKRSLLPKRMKLIVANPRKTALNRFAAQWLQYTPGQEIALINALCRAAVEEGLVSEEIRAGGAGWEAVSQGLSAYSTAQLAALAGVTEEAIREAARLFGGAKLGSILYGQAAAEGRDGAYLQAAVQNLAILSGHSEKDGHVALEVVQNANTWGARDMGALPEAGPGGQKTDRGLPTGDMLQAAAEGRIRALWVMGSNPLVEFPGAAKVRQAFEAVEFLVVQDMFLTETARLANVILPAVSVAERNCTLTNVEGRLQRTVRGMDPRGGAKEEWKTLALVAEEMEQPLGYSTADAVAKKIRSLLAENRGEAQAPRLQRVETPQPPSTDANFPMRLFTGRLMFDRSTIQRESTVLPTLAPEACVEIHPADGQRLGVADNETVGVNTPYGRLDLPVKLTADVPPGSVFVPYGYNETPVTALLTEGADVVSCRISRAGT
jgi:predicted molibdopterin-dependent oxidoreductase YjgC